jgi:hypothetical protein
MREVRRASQRSANYLPGSARVAISRALAEHNVNGEAEPFSCSRAQAVRFVSTTTQNKGAAACSTSRGSMPAFYQLGKPDRAIAPRRRADPGDRRRVCDPDRDEEPAPKLGPRGDHRPRTARLREAQESGVPLLRKPVPKHRLRVSIAHLIDASDNAVARRRQRRLRRASFADIAGAPAQLGCAPLG